MTARTADGQDPTAPAVPAKVHFPALDGYRALAALAVVVNHVAILSGVIVRDQGLGRFLVRADVGVSIFFLLSGFLLYRPFVAARLAGRPRPPFAPYLRRRALRILPAYWVALTVVAFVLHAPRFTDGHSVLAHYLLVHIYDTREISPGRYQITGGPIQQSWTLATEISFYLFLPVWAWWMARRQRPAERQIRVELLGLAVLWCGAIGLKVAGLLLDWREDRYGLVNAWLPFRLDEFALGMTLAVGSAWIAHRRIVLPAWVRGTAMTLGCWAVAALIFWITCTQLDMPLSPLFTPRQTFVVRLLYSFTALLLLLPAVLSRHGREGAPGPVRALFENPLVVWLGLVSYGIYIWHEAWQDVYLRWTDEGVFQSRFWQMLVFTVVLSTASAAVSWYLVERPALRYARPRAGDH